MVVLFVTWVIPTPKWMWCPWKHKIWLGKKSEPRWICYAITQVLIYIEDQEQNGRIEWNINTKTINHFSGWSYHLAKREKDGLTSWRSTSQSLLLIRSILCSIHHNLHSGTSIDRYAHRVLFVCTLSYYHTGVSQKITWFYFSELFNAPQGRYKSDVYLMPKLMDEFVARYLNSLDRNSHTN